MNIKTTNKDYAWSLLAEIIDPEVPALNIVELGIIRDVVVENTSITVVITPTYSGCPAMEMIENQIKNILQKNGFEQININVIYSPPWTTDWLSEKTKKKLKEYGITPPSKATFVNDPFNKIKEKILCPFCNSEETILKSQFGSTACKAIYYCNNCLQPFDYFKCH